MKVKKKSKEKFSQQRAREATEAIIWSEYPAFSFTHITKNNAFNMSHFTSGSRDMERCMSKLYEKLEKLSVHRWRDLLGLNKRAGIEFIPMHKLNFEPADSLIVSKDEKFISARFNGQDYRIIAVKQDKCPIMHVIGFDFDFSAYDHGG